MQSTVHNESASTYHAVPEAVSIAQLPLTTEESASKPKPAVKKPRVVKPKAQKEVVINQTAWPFEEPVVAKPTNKRSKKSTDSGEKSSVPVITATKKSSTSKPKAAKAKTAAVVPASKRSRTKKNV